MIGKENGSWWRHLPVRYETQRWQSHQPPTLIRLFIGNRNRVHASLVHPVYGQSIWPSSQSSSSKNIKWFRFGGVVIEGRQ